MLQAQEFFSHSLHRMNLCPKLKLTFDVICPSFKALRSIETGPILSPRPSRASLDERCWKEKCLDSYSDYFQIGLELRLVAELAEVDALLADDVADRLDKREL